MSKAQRLIKADYTRLERKFDEALAEGPEKVFALEQLAEHYSCIMEALESEAEFVERPLARMIYQRVRILK
jgi:hypothetical protein